MKKKLEFWLWRLSGATNRMSRDERGQDLIEYALLMGFMVIAVYVILPSDLMPAVSHVYSKLLNVAKNFGG